MILDSKEFGQYLKGLRKARELTIRQLEEASGVSNSYISQIEKGDKPVPSPEILKKLHKYLGVTYNDLMFHAGHITIDEINHDFGVMITLQGQLNGIKNIGEHLMINGEFRSEIKQQLARRLSEEGISEITTDQFMQRAEELTWEMIEKLKSGESIDELRIKNLPFLRILDQLMKLAYRPESALPNQLDDAIRHFVFLLMSGQVGERPFAGQFQEEYWKAINDICKKHHIKSTKQIDMGSPNRVQQMADSLISVENTNFKLDILNEFKRIAHQFHLWEDPAYEFGAKQLPVFRLENIVEHEHITYRDQPLDEPDRKRILDMLKVLFPDRQ
jgi:transcriptional regulator with XRE-family HTH domain